MIETGLIEAKCIENEEIIMKMTKLIRTTVIMKRIIIIIIIVIE